MDEAHAVVGLQINGYLLDGGNKLARCGNSIGETGWLGQSHIITPVQFLESHQITHVKGDSF